MDFVSNRFDFKSLVKKLHKIAESVEPEERDIYQEYVRLEDLNECFLKMYSDLHKHDAVNIREVDFSSFELNDLDDFYAFLEQYDHEMFELSEKILSFMPAAVSKPTFI